MKIMRGMRRMWQQMTGHEETPLDGDSPAWFISLVVHLALLVLFTILFYELPEQKPVDLLVTVLEKEVIEKAIPQEFIVSEELHEQVGADSPVDFEESLTAAPEFDEVSTPLAALFETTQEDELEEILLEGFEVASADWNEEVRSPNYVPIAHPRNSEGAIDIITKVILDSLDQRETLVVFMFDASVSLTLQREAVRDKLNTVYQELGIIEANGNQVFEKFKDKPLLTVVGYFGDRVDFITQKPTDSLSEIQAAINSIPLDRKGVERVFKAISICVDRYGHYRHANPRRNVLLVVFTDEVGDDQLLLEATIQKVKKNKIPVHVVGVPSPFGQVETKIKYVDPDPNYDQTPQWGRVNQGPESRFPERIKIHFAKTERDIPMDSGFGPFALTRLCKESGGQYIAVHPNFVVGRKVRKSDIRNLASHLEYFFDPEIMRYYAPEYISQKEYQKFLMANRARASLVLAAGTTFSWIGPTNEPKLKFPKKSDLELLKKLNNAQREPAKLMTKINAIYRVLKRGEKDREQLSRPRWKAGYDLAMGRIMANLVRTQTYFVMLEQVKRGLKFRNPKNNTWLLRPSDKIMVGNVMEKQADQARMYLKRVVDEHPGTPWALLAKRELSEPFGWEWREKYTDFTPPLRRALGVGGFGGFGRGVGTGRGIGVGGGGGGGGGTGNGVGGGFGSNKGRGVTRGISQGAGRRQQTPPLPKKIKRPIPAL